MTAAIVIRHDARQLPLPDESVDLVITSPPYWSLRSYTDGGEHYGEQLGSEASPKEFVANLVDCTREWVRVLKPTGSIFVNLGDKYAGSGGHNNAGIGAKAGRGPGRYLQDRGGIRPKSLMGLPWRYALECIDTLGLILRADIVWDKPNTVPEPHRDRVRRTHEQWFHFTVEGKHYGNVDPIAEHVEGKTALPPGVKNPPGQDRTGNGRHRWVGGIVSPRGKIPPSVWRIPSEPLKVPAELNIEHFAAFPSEWPVRLVLAWSPPGGVVLDPFGGSGTTALAAQELGRVGITNDLSSDYCRLAQWRTTDEKQIARIRKRIGDRA